MPRKIQFTKEQKIISDKNHKLAKKFFGIENGSGKCLHHTNVNLIYEDIDRYIKWLPEDLEVMTLSEHAKLHITGRKWSEESKAKRRGSGNPRYGKSPWNKGLTKETDERIANYGRKESLTKQERNNNNNYERT